jgi:hypothetical protein
MPRRRLLLSALPAQKTEAMNMMTGIVWGETEDQTHLPRYYRRVIWVQQEEEDLQRPQHQSRSENAP